MEEPIRDQIETMIRETKKAGKKGNILVIDMNSYFRLKSEVGIIDDEIINWAGMIVHIVPLAEKKLEIL